jgi:hypothetical protein
MYQKSKYGWLNTSLGVVQESLHNTNVGFGIGALKIETSMEQVNVLITYTSLVN